MATQTRGVLGVHIDTVDKIGRIEFDAYPAFAGQHLVRFLQNTPQTRLAEFARALRVVRGLDRPQPYEVARLRRYAATADFENEDGEGAGTWGHLLHETEGDLAAILEAGVVVDCSGRLRQSELCAWAYVVNVDSGALEVYRGEQHRKGLGRYALAATAPDASGYWPVSLVKQYSLAALPDDMVADLKADGVPT